MRTFLSDLIGLGGLLLVVEMFVRIVELHHLFVDVVLGQFFPGILGTFEDVLKEGDITLEHVLDIVGQFSSVSVTKVNHGH